MTATHEDDTEENDGTRWTRGDWIDLPAHMPEQPLKGFWIGVCHGFNVKDKGAGTTDTMTPLLERLGATVVEFDRDWDGLVEASLERDAQADRVAAAVKRASATYYPSHIALVGHSHGCSIIHRAYTRDPHLQLRAQRAVLINPALRCNVRFPQHVVYRTYFSPNDRVVTTSKWLRILPWRWLWPHPWGEAGRKGIVGGLNVNLETLTGQRIEHSTIFKAPRLTGALVSDMAYALWNGRKTVTEAGTLKRRA